MQVDASYLLKQTATEPVLASSAQAMFDNSSSILSQLRSLLAQLRPYGLQGDEEHGIALEEALRELVRQRQSRGENALECHLHTALEGETLPPRLAVAVYRIAQEALTNVMRHSSATRVWMSLEFERERGQLNLVVTDNGKGMPENVSPGLGMAGIRERVLANQGELVLSRAKPSGLTLKASFPLC